MEIDLNLFDLIKLRIKLREIRRWWWIISVVFRVFFYRLIKVFYYLEIGYIVIGLIFIMIKNFNLLLLFVLMFMYWFL